MNYGSQWALKWFFCKKKVGFLEMSELHEGNVPAVIFLSLLSMKCYL